MCGIAGLLTRAADDAPRAMVTRMVAAMHHRGPDGEGIFAEGGIALGHARLAIIDLSGGAQPLWTADDEVGVVFNGEIYNYRELRADLEARGHRFRTQSDTECLVAAYREYGTDMVGHLRGMFAFAILDRPARRVFLARDRFGIKPLVWYHDGERFLFASDLDALYAASPALDDALSPEGQSLFFSFSYVPAPHTIYRRAWKLPPGHTLVIDEADLQPHIQAYWDLRSVAVDPTIDEQSALERLRHAIGDAVRARLVADVPLGAFLSGGVDSSLVVAAMCAHAGGRVRTFSIGFDEAGYDEMPWARAVAEHLGTEHTEERLRPDVMRLVADVVERLDEPFGDSSAIPTWCVAAMAREHVTVALSGDGGDELFVGYERYARGAVAECMAKVPGAALSGAAGALRPWADQPHARRARRLMSRAALPFPERYATSLLFLPEGDSAAAAIAPELRGDDLAFAHLASFGLDRGGVRDMARLDALVYLPDDILTKVDRMTMASSLEARVPLLDHPLAELALAIPPALHHRGLTLKRLLKRLLTEHLPAPLVHRKKQGFAVPLPKWFRGPLRPLLHDVLLAPGALQRGITERRGVEALLAEHAAGRDRSGPLWMLLVHELWMRKRSRRAR